MEELNDLLETARSKAEHSAAQFLASERAGNSAGGDYWAAVFSVHADYIVLIEEKLERGE